MVTASLLASKGFSAALASWDAERLQEDAAKVRCSAAVGENTVNIETFPIDAADHVAF